MSTRNIGFYEEISKIITFNYHQISSNTHLFLLLNKIKGEHDTVNHFVLYQIIVDGF